MSQELINLRLLKRLLETLSRLQMNTENESVEITRRIVLEEFKNESEKQIVDDILTKLKSK